MQNIVITKPYKYVPPHRGNWWPAFIQKFRLIDRWLKNSHGIVEREVRDADKLRRSIRDGHGILIAPNHCRPCDPIAMGWLARAANTHVFAMASWHLYNQSRFTAFAIQKMGGFSVHREGIDRQAIREAIGVLVSGERPLIVFPEGGVTRTNDRLQSLLDGVGFIARSAAKKRAASSPQSQVVVHPVGVKYLHRGNLEAELDPVLTDIERRLSWRPQRSVPLIDRITKVGMTLLALKEIEYLGRPQDKSFCSRLDSMVDYLLSPLEQEWVGADRADQPNGIISRVKMLRMKITPELVTGQLDAVERARRWRQLEDCYLAQQIASYPHDYLEEVTSEERILETVERFVEDLTDRTPAIGQLKCVIQVGDPITVEPQYDRSAEHDPLMTRIAKDIQQLLDELQSESTQYRPSSATHPPADSPDEHKRTGESGPSQLVRHRSLGE